MAANLSGQSSAFATTINGAAALIFFVVALLVLLHSIRCFYGRCLQRRYMITRGGNLQNPNMQIIAFGNPEIPPAEPPNTGLAPSVIAALPTFVYKKPVESDGTYDTTECSICLSTAEEEETVKLLPNCSHLFHVECIDMWLNSHTTCPICRAAVEPEAPSVPKQELHGETHLLVLDLDHEARTSTAPPLEPLSTVTPSSETTSDDTAQSSKGDTSTSRPSSFRRILSWNRSGRKFQQLELSADHGVEDPERQ